MSKVADKIRYRDLLRKQCVAEGDVAVAAKRIEYLKVMLDGPQPLYMADHLRSGRKANIHRQMVTARSAYEKAVTKLEAIKVMLSLIEKGL